MSEAELTFVEHLQRTRPQSTVKYGLRLTSSGFNGHKDATAVSRLEITPSPTPGKLPTVRSQLLSRMDDFDESRFLLDQTIDLNTTDIGIGGDKTKIEFDAWDQQGAKTRQVPIDAFMAFSQTALRLLDYLLPVPRFEIDAADRRLYQGVVSFQDGRQHIAAVADWDAAGGLQNAKDITVTDVDGRWTRTEFVHTTPKPDWGADKFTRHRLGTNTF